jgi:hypothetical protein
MKLFNEWLSSQDQPVKVIGEPAGLNAYLLPSGIGLEDVFKAGMLAAADMVHGVPTLKQQIIEAANENN